MSATVTVTAVYVGRYEVQIVETNCAPTTVVAITGLPPSGTVIRVQSQLTGGTGTTIDPILGRTSNPGTANQKDVVVVPVAPTELSDVVDKCGEATYHCTTTTGTTGTLWHESRPDAGSDNAITTVYHIIVGW